MHRASVIIPTYNRPDELSDCVQSILHQTVKPQEIVVVDDGDLGTLPWRNECREAGIRYLHIHKRVPGLTESRNIGITSASGDIICFLDDDTVLFPDYIEQMLRTYEEDPDHQVGGVGGLVANTGPFTLASALRYVYNVLFLISAFRQGRVLPSGFCVDFGTTPFPLRQTTEVDFLPGGVSSYRREVFEAFSFAPKFNEIALGEDKEFSFRASRNYRLLLNPDARLYHYESPVMRPGKREGGRKFLIGHFLLFRDYVKRHWYDWLFFFYATIGYVLARTIIMLVSLDKREAQHVRGVLDALKTILSGNVPARKGKART